MENIQWKPVGVALGRLGVGQSHSNRHAAADGLVPHDAGDNWDGATDRGELWCEGVRYVAGGI